MNIYHFTDVEKKTEYNYPTPQMKLIFPYN